MALLSLLDLPAPAKLNLFLHVVGRRPDGYHLLQSLFVLIDWSDTLHVELRRDGRLQRHDLGPELPADDLALRAARALQQASGCALGADISVLKRVPWGAGMGGGSSDAATVLLALNRLWGLAWPRERLLALGLTLGADVPFFIGGRNAFVEGVGERLTPVAWPATHYVVLKPPQPVATGAIFSHPDLARDTEPVILEGSLTSLMAASKAPAAIDAAPGVASEQQPGQRPGQPRLGRNDLQPVAERLCPAIAEAARWLEDRFGNSRMTGSGSAVFAELGPAHGAGAQAPQAGERGGGNGRALGEDLDLPAGWVGRTCRSLDHHPLRDWAG